MRSAKLLSFFLVLHFSGIVAQSLPDSLSLALRNSKEDDTRADALFNIASFYFGKNNYDSTRIYGQKLSSFAKANDNTKALAFFHYVNGILFDSQSDFNSAIKEFEAAVPLLDNVKDSKPLAHLYQDIANSYYSLGTNDKSLTNYMLSLKLREAAGDSNAIASSYMGISNVYNQMHRNDLSLTFAKKALRLKEKYKDQRSASWLLNNIGSIYLDLHDTSSALNYYERSIALKKQLNDDYGLATSYNNIGTIHLRERKFNLALSYYRLSLRIREKLNPEGGFEMAFCYDHIGSVFIDMGMDDSALYYTSKAVEIGEKAHSYEILRTPYMNMAKILAKKKKYDEAYSYLMKHIDAKDSTLSSQTNQLMNEMAAKYDNEKKEQQIAVQQLEISDQKKTNMLFIAIAGFAVVLTFVMLRGFLAKKKANSLLEEKNTLIEQQKEIVEEKNKDITDSIVYAQRIQRAILPSQEYQNKLIADSFTLYKPKAIVSGDFYWIERWGKKTIIACVDCTGHGVPGAFMTFVAYSLLNEAVLEHGIDKPAAILNEMRKNLNRMLRQKNDSEALKDGMDISICAIDESNMTMEYAGAYNPLWLVRNNAIIETRADKQPIGVFLDTEPKPFTEHTIALEKGDMFYLFTDGYADQFGGEKGKKFKYKSLQQLLLSIHHKPVAEQKQILDLTFENWRGDLQQLDDVCILGVRIPA